MARVGIWHFRMRQYRAPSLIFAARRSRKLLAAPAVMMLVLGLLVSPGLSGGPTVKGDATAWKEILAAFNRMNAAKTFRMKGTIGVTAAVVEAVMPNRYHTRMEWPEGKVFEAIRVGSEVRFRNDGQRWTCAPALQLNLPNTDPSGLSATVVAAKGPVAMIDGVVTQSYTYTFADRGYTVHLYVTIAEGLPKRVETFESTGAVDSTFDYYDYGAPVTIGLPTCT
jgi:hypothetical protein